jgi:hypothetical protein
MLIVPDLLASSIPSRSMMWMVYVCSGLITPTGFRRWMHTIIGIHTADEEEDADDTQIFG